MENAFQVVTNVARSWFIWSLKSNKDESFAQFALFLHILPKSFAIYQPLAKTVVKAQIETLNVRDKERNGTSQFVFVDYISEITLYELM